MSKLTQRDAFWNRIFELAKKDHDIVVVSEDMGAPALDQFRVELPDQFVNVGIAEQNLVSIAAGLATYPEGCLEAMQNHFTCHILKAGEIAESLGSAKCMNIVLFGSMVKALGMDDVVDWEQVIADTVPPKFKELNLKAYRAGHDAVKA